MTDKETFRQRNQLLVDELRSGQHVQGRCKLNRDDKKCCLGVACIVAKENGLDLQAEPHPIEDNVVMYNMEVALAPPEVCAWYGWNLYKQGNPVLYYQSSNSQTRSTGAIEMNDIWFADFETIADAFERTYVNGA